MRTAQEIREELLRQLAIEYHCTPADFSKDENVITVPCDHPERRKYTSEIPPFAMVTLGGNAVISADSGLHPRLSDYVSDKRGIWLFEHRHLLKIDELLMPYGVRICQTSHMFLPKPMYCDVTPSFTVRCLEQGDIHCYYGDERFSNALCDTFHPERPDILAICALIDGEVAGMAGCSADTETMWQIGIDVLPAYRGRGIGKTLVALLRDEIFRRGAIPFYGTSLSNLHSWHIALASGFVPVWTELYLEKIR